MTNKFHLKCLANASIIYGSLAGDKHAIASRPLARPLARCLAQSLSSHLVRRDVQYRGEDYRAEEFIVYFYLRVPEFLVARKLRKASLIRTR